MSVTITMSIVGGPKRPLPVRRRKGATASDGLLIAEALNIVYRYGKASVSFGGP
jgi:hypothetical protein